MLQWDELEYQQLRIDICDVTNLTYIALHVRVLTPVQLTSKLVVPRGGC